MARLDHTGTADDDGPLQDVSQLADVAWPGETFKQLQNRIAGAENVALMLGVHLLDEGAG